MGWTWEILALDGTPLSEVQPAGRRLNLRRKGTPTAGMAFTTYTATGDGGVPDTIPFDAWAERDLLVSHDGTPVFRGQVLAVPTLDATTAQFTAVGVADILTDRLIPAGREILAREATQMAWMLIDDTQQLPGGDLQIRSGSLPNTVARSKKWEQLTPVRQAIDELAAMDNGFDWAIEPDTDGDYVFTTWAGSRGGGNGVVLEWGRNIQGMSLSVDAGAGRIGNSGVAVGSNQVTVRADDQESILRHRLRERVTVSNEQDDATILGDTARGLLERPRWVPRLTLQRDPDGVLGTTLDDIGLGDTVEVSVHHGWISLEGVYRVEEIVVSWPAGSETEQLEVTVTPA